MNPELIVFGIRAAIRLAAAADKAYTQHARDKAVLLPSATVTPAAKIELIVKVFADGPHKNLVDSTGRLSRYWKDGAPNPDVEDAFAILMAEARQLEVEGGSASTDTGLSDRTKELAGSMIIEQWAEDKGPIRPLGRMVLIMTDVALDYFVANPGILGIGGNGEKLIAAFAFNLEQLIPDDAENFGPKSQFAERMVQIVLSAGLETFQENPTLIANEKHLQKLIVNSLPPVIKALPTKLSEQSKWQDVADALVGPASSAAIQTIAENQKAFLGSDFAADKAFGALTNALLNQAAKTGLVKQFSAEGYIGLYRSALEVVAAHPELFLGKAKKNVDKIANALLSSVAEKLQTAEVPFNGDIGLQLAVAALEILKTNAPILFDESDAWEQVANGMLQQVVGGLSVWIDKKAWKEGKIPFSTDQLVELGRIFLIQAGKTPGMLAGNRTEVKAIVAGVAKAMSADSELLLTADNWLMIAAVAAEEAAANPGRLFGLKEDKDVEAIGTEIIGALLQTASESFKTLGRNGQGVLFGDTLKEAIVVTLRSTGGNVAKVASPEGQAALKKLSKNLNQIVGGSPKEFGSKEWLRLYRSQIGSVLKTGKFEDLTKADMLRILEGERK